MELEQLKIDLQNAINEMESKRQSGLDISSNEATVAILKHQIMEAESQQDLLERVQAEEAEIELITLPYDFNEILSEEGHVITKANDMIIEVVKDTKRQANIEKNQALDELKAAFTEKENGLQFKIDSMQTIIENGTAANAELTREIGDVRSYLQQVNLERDDAFNKRDAAFRQLQEAREEIETMRIKLENMPAAKQSLDISPSDKLAKMVKESLEEKVNRGLARWDIPTLAIPELEPINLVTEQEENAEHIPIESNQMDANTNGADQTAVGNESVEQVVEQESEVITLESLHERVKALELKVAA